MYMRSYVRSCTLLTVRTLSYVNRPTSGPLRPPSRSAELRPMPEVGRKCLESAHFRLTSGPALLRFTSVHLRPTSAHFCAIPRGARRCDYRTRVTVAQPFMIALQAPMELRFYPSHHASHTRRQRLGHLHRRRELGRARRSHRLEIRVDLHVCKVMEA